MDSDLKKYGIICIVDIILVTVILVPLCFRSDRPRWVHFVPFVYLVVRAILYFFMRKYINGYKK